MPAETWRCPDCHKNNTIGATACVTCGRAASDAKPGAGTRQRATRPEAMTATERERVVSAADEPVRQAAPTPTGRVRFSGRAPSRSVREPPVRPPTRPAPPKVSTAPPPFRAAPPPMPATASGPPRRDLAGVAKVVLWTAAVLVIGLIGWPLAQEIAEQSSASGAGVTTDQAPTTQPCPAEAAAWLPGASGTLVARYQTTDFVITLCQTADGRLFYDGQVKGQPQSQDTHISLPAQAYGDGYIAYNLDYTYQITGGRIVVSKSGTVLRDEVLQPA